MQDILNQLKKRVVSLLWRAGCVGSIAALALISEQLGTLELPNWAVVIVGLGLSEATKWLSNNKKRFGGALKFR